MVCCYETEKTRHDPNCSQIESATTHFSAGYISPHLKKSQYSIIANLPLALLPNQFLQPEAANGEQGNR